MILIIVGVITIVIILPEKLNTLKNKEQIPACEHVNAGIACLSWSSAVPSEISSVSWFGLKKKNI